MFEGRNACARCIIHKGNCFDRAKRGGVRAEYDV